MPIAHRRKVTNKIFSQNHISYVNNAYYIHSKNQRNNLENKIKMQYNFCFFQGGFLQFLKLTKLLHIIQVLFGVPRRVRAKGQKHVVKKILRKKERGGRALLIQYKISYYCVIIKLLIIKCNIFLMIVKIDNVLY